MIICAGKIENFSFATPIGIGLIESAINLTKILCENRAENLIFIGTAGLYKSGEILKIYESKVAFNIEISALLGLSYSPLKYENFDDVSCETYAVNSSNFITTDKISAENFAKKGFFMENMEFFSVVKVAEIFKIPVRGIFATTNFCDQNAHRDFIKNHEKAKNLLTDYLKNRNLI